MEKEILVDKPHSIKCSVEKVPPRPIRAIENRHFNPKLNPILSKSSKRIGHAEMPGICALENPEVWIFFNCSAQRDFSKIFDRASTK